MFNKINKLTTTLLAGAMLLGLNSCDIEADNRFEDLGAAKAVRTSLLMDFTGQQCVNCPEAHEIMAGLANQYSSNLVTVSIHGGAMATSVDRTNFDRNLIGLMIKEGDEMNDAFGISSWPMGSVDRINDPNAALNSLQWAGAVRSAVEVPTDITIEASASLEGDNIEVTTRVLCTSNRNVALQVWVVEDGIVAHQTTPSGRDMNYVHNHVLRFVQYPVKSGKALALAPNVWADDNCTITVKNTDKERWNKANLSVVAFAFDGTQILNTIKVPVTEETAE